jgi:hypothetical protein
MPTVHSIFANLEKGSFCSIDPLNAYYLLSPDDQQNNLERTKDFFKQHKLQVFICFKLQELLFYLLDIYVFNFVTLQGTLGYMPSINELTSAMEKHDLFIYMGHGCGKLIYYTYGLLVMSCRFNCLRVCLCRVTGNFNE